MIWKGCLSCHADNGAFNYAVHNSQENNAGQMASAILTSFFGSRIGSGKPSGPSSFDDIVTNPKSLMGKSADEIGNILGEGWQKGSYGSKGTGWKFTKDDGSVFYHPGGGRHGGSYYGFSNGKLGKNKVVGSDYIPLKGDKATIHK